MTKKKDFDKNYVIIGVGVGVVLLLAIIARLFSSTLPAQLFPGQPHFPVTVDVTDANIALEETNSVHAFLIIKDDQAGKYGGKYVNLSKQGVLFLQTPLPSDWPTASVSASPATSLDPSVPPESPSPSESPSPTPSPSISVDPSVAPSASPETSPSPDASPSPAFWTVINFPSLEQIGKVFVGSGPTDIEMTIENIDPADVECVAVEFNVDPCGNAPFIIQPITVGNVPVCRRDQVSAQRIKPSVCPQPAYPY